MQHTLTKMLSGDPRSAATRDWKDLQLVITDNSPAQSVSSIVSMS
jgi:hypothetical protein